MRSQYSAGMLNCSVIRNHHAPSLISAEYGGLAGGIRVELQRKKSAKLLSMLNNAAWGAVDR